MDVPVCRQDSHAPRFHGGNEKAVKGVAVDEGQGFYNLQMLLDHWEQ